MNRFALTAATTASALFLLAGCGDPAADPVTEGETVTEAQPQPETSPHAWVLTSDPGNAVSITDAKASAKEGDQVVIKGRIGGRHEPISAGSPVFTIVDMDLAYCGQHTDDACGTPWDYCCETPETIAANAATVQVVGGDEIDPAAAGLKPLDEVILVGIVGPRPDAKVLTIQATGVYPTGG